MGACFIFLFCHQDYSTVNVKIPHLVNEARKIIDNEEDYCKAIIYLEKAYHLLDQSQFVSSKISVYLNLSECYYYLSELDKLQNIVNEACNMIINSKDDSLLADVDYIRSLYFLVSNDDNKAEKLLNNAISINYKLGRIENLAYSYYRRSVVHYHKKDSKLCISDLQNALGLFIKIGRPRLGNRIKGLLGVQYADLLLYTKAEEYLLDAIRISKINNWQHQYVQGLNNLASIYQELYDDQHALELFQIVNRTAKKLQSSTLEIASCLGICQCYYNLKNYNDALSIAEEGLSLSRQHSAKPKIIDLFILLGQIYIDRNQLEKAKQMFNSAEKEIFQQHDITAYYELYMSLAWYDEKINKIKSSILNVFKAVHILEKSRKLVNPFSVLSMLGKLYLKDRQYNSAKKYLNQAIEFIENNRLEYQKNSQLRELFTDATSWTYKSLTSAYIALGQIDSAFITMERAKGRASIEKFRDDYLQRTSSIPDSIKLRIRELSSKINSLNEQLDDKSVQSSIEIKIKISKLEKEKEHIKKSIIERNSFIKNTQSIHPVSLNETQKLLIPYDRIIIEYAITEDHINAIALTSDNAKGLRIEMKRDTLLNLIGDMIDQLRQEGTRMQDPSFSIKKSAELYHLLIQPFEGLIASKKELIIIPDDILCSLPFEMLVTDTKYCLNDYDVDHVKFLIEKIDISYAVSATLLRHDFKTKNLDVAGVLLMSDPQIGQIQSSNNARFNEIFPSSDTKRGSINLPRLPFADKEIEGIQSIFSKYILGLFRGRSATEENFKNFAPHAQIIHIAAHQIIDENHPFSSKIILAANGLDNEKYGSLNVGELLDMKLNGDLVVLSACQTGKGGKFIMGDGFRSMAQGFYLAGIPSVVMTMWNVEDQQSCELMKLFYQNLYVGQSKSEALANAKREMLKRGNRHPYFWAGYILQGNSDPVKMRPVHTSILKYTLIISIILVSFALFYFYKRTTRLRKLKQFQM